MRIKAVVKKVISCANGNTGGKVKTMKTRYAVEIESRNGDVTFSECDTLEKAFNIMWSINLCRGWAAVIFVNFGKGWVKLREDY